MTSWLHREVNDTAKPWAVIDPNGPHGDEIICGFVASQEQAALIAAAPDLYDAVEVLSKFFEGTDSPLNTIAQNALAKARGQQS